MFGWLRRWREKHETVEEVYAKRGVDINQAPPLTRARNYLWEPMPTPKREERDSSGDFATGFLMGEASSGGNVEAGLIGGALGGVTGGIIGAEIAGPEHQETPTPEPVQFGGGESGGAGSSGSWEDSPSCDTSTSDTSSSDSSSSCDSSSSDSGSSGTDY